MNLSHDTETRFTVYSRLIDPLLEEAIPKDPDLLTEIQCFWNDPMFLESTLSKRRISSLAMKVIGWLKVGSVPRSIRVASGLSNFFPITAPLFVRDVMIHLKKRCRFGKPIFSKKTPSEISQSSPD